MKRYLLFLWGMYELGNGWRDLKSTSDSIEELNDCIKNIDDDKDESPLFGNFNWQIVDTQTMKIIEEG